MPENTETNSKSDGPKFVDSNKLTATQIMQFIDEQSNYENLAREVAYILEKRLNDQNIDIDAVTYRSKTFRSFIEKTNRNHYENPFSQITDRAGVRVVYLYISDLPKINEIVNQEFVILEDTDKLNNRAEDSFGYNARHYVIKLGKHSSGARYDDLKDLKCEIQVRTIAQDAWAIISHHIVYKNEASVPKHLSRKLNSLVGLFETADDQFDQIRLQRDKYLSDIKEKEKQPKGFLDQELNLDTLRAYTMWKFPDTPTPSDSYLSYNILNHMDLSKYKTLRDIDEIVTRGLPAVKADIRSPTSQGRYIHAAEYVLVAFAFADDDFYNNQSKDNLWSENAKKAFAQFKHLVKKP